MHSFEAENPVCVDTHLDRLIGALRELLVVDHLLSQVHDLCGERLARPAPPRRAPTASVAAAASTTARRGAS